MALPSNRNPRGGLPQRPVNPINNGAPKPELPDASLPGLPEIVRESLPIPPEVRPSERLGQYDFGSEAVERPQREVAPEQEEDPFESLSIEESYEDEEEPAPVQRPRREAPVRETPKNPEPSMFDAIENEYEDSRAVRRKEELEKVSRRESRKKPEPEYRPQAGELDDKGQNVFLDKKAKKVKPFGGKKSMKVSDVDPRKNLKQRAKAVQVGILSLLVLILGAGVYNAVVPKPTLTEADVVNTIYQTTNTSAFPLEQGKGFAQDFIKAYIELDSNPASGTLLNYFYNGTATPASGTSFNTRQVGKGFGSTVLYGPTVYEASHISDNAANYVIGAFIEPRDIAQDGVTNDSGNLVNNPNPDGANGIWQFFSVNVYYDSENKEFGITPESPVLVPAPASIASSDIPEDSGFAYPSWDQPNEIRPTVDGFMEAYRTSSPTDFDKLKQFLPKNPDVELLTGLDGNYEFAGDVSDAVKLQAFADKTESGKIKEVKAVLTVDWLYSLSEEATSKYTSKYVMTLEPSDNSYVVTRFVPFYYDPVVSE